MYRIYIDDETNELILNFEEIAEEYSDYLDDCYECLDDSLKKFNINEEFVDSAQDYRYSIAPTGASSEDIFNQFEVYLIEQFESLEERIEDDLEERIEDDEYDEDNEYLYVI